MRGGHNFVDIAGRKFNLLTAISISEKRKYGVYWLCQCDCGNQKVILGQHLKSGGTKSCGCHNKRVASANNLKHGHSLTGKTQTIEYKSWLDMKARCTNPNSKYYYNYGGRGITICDRWLNSFEAFLEDMGMKPTKKHTLERTNNEGDYNKYNCIWATRKVQNRNTRANHYIEYGGRKLSMAEWAETIGINYGTLRSRINRGWSTERALFE